MTPLTEDERTRLFEAGGHFGQQERPTEPSKTSNRIDDPYREHWTNGGTWITNISTDPALYEAAMKEAGETRLVIRDTPSGKGLPEWKSLHYTSPPKRGDADLGKFWRAFERLRPASRTTAPHE